MSDFISPIAARLAAIPGVQAVVLGGSRARAEDSSPDSDYDLGLYYDAARPFDLAALNNLVRELDDSAAQATPPGGWGPWVDGGANMTVQGVRVDFIYRELGRVANSVDDALAGHVSLHAQPGHPHGIHGHSYAAELAVCQVLSDAGSEVAALNTRLGGYPTALKVALMTHYGWQPEFWLDFSAKGAGRGDVHYVQGCLYQSVMALVQTVCAHAGMWLLNEKGAVALAGRTPGAPPELAARVNAALSALDADALRTLSREVGARTAQTT